MALCCRVSLSPTIFFLSLFEIEFLCKKVIEVSQREDTRVNRKYNTICHLKEKNGLNQDKSHLPINTLALLASCITTCIFQESTPSFQIN
jgi:hypothetical protein